MKASLSRSVIIALLLVPVLCFWVPGIVHAGGPESYDFTIGVGRNLNSGCSTEQVLLIPAAQWSIDRIPSLKLRLEGPLEIINHDGTLTVVVGVAPMVRLFLAPGSESGFFIEGGAGANYISRQSIGSRDLGGSFIFSPSGGAGYVFSRKGRDCALSLRYRHISNAGIYSENAGMDSLYLMGTISF